MDLEEFAEYENELPEYDGVCKWDSCLECPVASQCEQGREVLKEEEEGEC